MKRIAVATVWFEADVGGTAAAYHLAGTRRRLGVMGDLVSRVHVVRNGSSRRFSRLVSVTLRSLTLPRGTAVVLCRWHPAVFLPGIIWRARGLRVVFLVQGTLHDAQSAHNLLGSRLAAALSRSSLRRADAWVVPHSGIGDWLREDIGVDSRQIQHAANGYPIHEPEGTSPPHVSRPYVVFAGALAAWQGVSVMLDAIRQPAWPADVTLVIVGDGPERAKIVESGDRAQLRYLGRLAPSQVAQLIAGSICSLSPKILNEVTRRGISPFKLLEAGSLGKPIVASDVPGQAEYMREHHPGILISPGSPGELAEAVRRLRSDPALAAELGANGLAASDSYAWELGVDAVRTAMVGSSEETRR